jgi:hypothetical protein
VVLCVCADVRCGVAWLGVCVGMKPWLRGRDRPQTGGFAGSEGQIQGDAGDLQWHWDRDGERNVVVVREDEWS